MTHIFPFFSMNIFSRVLALQAQFVKVCIEEMPKVFVLAGTEIPSSFVVNRPDNSVNVCKWK